MSGSPLRRFDGEAHSLDALKRLLAYSARYIQGLSLEQVPSHLEWEIVFANLGKYAPHTPGLTL